MGNFESIVAVVEDKFEKLDRKIHFLQDIILNMKIDFELITRSKLEKKRFSKITELIDKNLNYFLDERHQNCEYLNPCIILTEKNIFKILRVYTNNGSKSALKLLKSHLEDTKNYTAKCPENSCLKNVLKIYNSLNEILSKSLEYSNEINHNLISRINQIQIDEYEEKKICKILTPLTNENRLKILKILSKGSAYYTQLERQVGLSGGHFHFHLDKLIEGEYVIRDEEKGLYLITNNGLRALKLLFELSKDILI